MPSVCLCFQVHQPVRLRAYTFFDIRRRHNYEDTRRNPPLLRRLAEHSYLPANAILLEAIRKHGGDFQVAFALSGVALDQFQTACPEVIDGFKALAATGHVEFLVEPSHHSLALLYSPGEFEDQVQAHRQQLRTVLGVEATTFRHPGLIYSNTVARAAAGLGCAAVLADGTESLLGWRSPSAVYQAAGEERLRLLLRNRRLSEEIVHRFQGGHGKSRDLTARAFARQLQQSDPASEVILIDLDYTRFGDRGRAESGLMAFLKELPAAVLDLPEFRFGLPAAVARGHVPAGRLEVPNYLSGVGPAHDLSPWMGNDMQRDAAETLYGIEKKVRASADRHLLETWRRLQTADHFAWMDTHPAAAEAGRPARAASPYPSPYDAYINYMNVLTDLSCRGDHAGG